LDVKTVFTKDDMRNTFNTLFINDYCIWIMTVAKPKLQATAAELQSALGYIRDHDIGWDLALIEQQAIQELMNSEDIED